MGKPSRTPEAPGEQLVARMMDVSWRRFGRTVPEWGRALCERAGIPEREVSSVRAWREGRSTVAGMVLLAAADVIDITVDELRELAAQELGWEYATPLRTLTEKVRDLATLMEQHHGRLDAVIAQVEDHDGRLATVEEVLQAPAEDGVIAGFPSNADRTDR